MKHYGLRCQACGYSTKILYGVEMKFESREMWNKDGSTKLPVVSNANLCRRCMRKFGLMEREHRDIDA
jgi:hypothetical protein